MYDLDVAKFRDAEILWVRRDMLASEFAQRLLYD
jgi:hypothetical protein